MRKIEHLTIFFFVIRVRYSRYDNFTRRRGQERPKNHPCILLRIPCGLPVVVVLHCRSHRLLNLLSYRCARVNAKKYRKETVEKTHARQNVMIMETPLVSGLGKLPPLVPEARPPISRVRCACRPYTAIQYHCGNYSNPGRPSDSRKAINAPLLMLS